MPYLCSYKPTFIFYATFKSEVLRIAKNTLKYEDFKPRIVSLFIRMVNQGGNYNKLIRCKADVPQKPFVFFQSFSKFSGDIAKNITKEVK